MGWYEDSFEIFIGYFINMMVVWSKNIGFQLFIVFIWDLQLIMVDGLDYVVYLFLVLVRELNVDCLVVYLLVF